MKIWCYILAIVALTACGYNEFGEPAPGAGEAPLPTTRIATLRSFYRGAPVSIRDEKVVVSGYVTTSDRSNNFYRSLVIEDATGAVEIMAGLYDLHNLYRVGQRIVVDARGLTLGMRDGMLQLGWPGVPGSRYEVDYIGYAPEVARHLFRTGDYRKAEPLPVLVAELRPELTGRLVRVSGLRCEWADTTWALPARLAPGGVPRTASIKFRTGVQDSLYVITSGYAGFAGEKVPAGRLGVTGVLLGGEVAGKEVYQLKIRDLDDVENESD